MVTHTKLTVRTVAQIHNQLEETAAGTSIKKEGTVRMTKPFNPKKEKVSFTDRFLKSPATAAYPINAGIKPTAKGRYLTPSIILRENTK